MPYCIEDEVHKNQTLNIFVEVAQVSLITSLACYVVLLCMLYECERNGQLAFSAVVAMV